MSTGALDNVSVPNESTLVAPPPPDSPGAAWPPLTPCLYVDILCIPGADLTVLELCAARFHDD